MKKIIFLIMILLSVSCINKTSQSEKAFMSYMNTLQQKGEFLQFIGFSGNDWKLMKYAPYFTENSRKITFKVIKTEEKQNNSTITVSVKSPDLAYYNTLYPKYLPEEDYGKYLEKKADFFKTILEKEDLKYHEKTIHVYMILKNGIWIMDSSVIENSEFKEMTNHKIF